MTKLSYYMCTDTNGNQNLLYGTSKKEVIAVGEKLGLGNFTTIEEQNYNELKTKFDEKQLLEIRKNSKEKWDRKVATVAKNKKKKE